MLSEKQLQKLAKEATGTESLTEAIEVALRGYVEQKLSQYEATITELEARYGVDFNAFEAKVGNELPLSWENEQAYMTWQEAITNLEHFHEIAAKLKVHA